MYRTFLIGMVVIPFIAAGCAWSPETMTVREAWARPAGAGESTAVYLQILNPLEAGDTLYSVAGEIAEAVEIHRSERGEAGVMRMRRQESVPVPGKGRVEFRPGGLHVMLAGLREPLTEGDLFKLEFRFEAAGEMRLQVPVVDR